MGTSKLLFILALGVMVSLNVMGCKKRPGAGGVGGDGVGDVVGTRWDDPNAGELGGRFGVDGEMLEGQFQAVLFGYDSAQVVPSERPQLETVADYMRRNPSARLVVEGHCDERGSREYNLSLGERRALAARAYLIGLGVDGQRIQTKSFGSEQPVAFGHDENAWRQNRRAEFVIIQ